MWRHTVRHGRGSDVKGKLANAVGNQHPFTLPRNMVYPALLPLMPHTSAASSRLNWRPPADLNGLVRFAEIRNLVSARVPSHFNWPLATKHQTCNQPPEIISGIRWRNTWITGAHASLQRVKWPRLLNAEFTPFGTRIHKLHDPSWTNAIENYGILREVYTKRADWVTGVKCHYLKFTFTNKATSKMSFFFTFVPYFLILSKFYLFTNWCTSELS